MPYIPEEGDICLINAVSIQNPVHQAFGAAQARFAECGLTPEHMSLISERLNSGRHGKSRPCVILKKYTTTSSSPSFAPLKATTLTTFHQSTDATAWPSPLQLVYPIVLMGLTPWRILCRWSRLLSG